jgi:hypothetical protein
LSFNNFLCDGTPLFKNDKMINDTFDVIANDDRKQFEFTPKVEGYTSYIVGYDEVDNIEDAQIAVWKSIKAEEARKRSVG